MKKILLLIALAMFCLIGIKAATNKPLTRTTVAQGKVQGFV